MATLCPLDSRYQKISYGLIKCISDQQYYFNRLRVELWYLSILLKKRPELPQELPVFDFEKDGDEIYAQILEIEVKTQHDVKAIERFLKREIKKINPLVVNLIHCGLTSQDVNSVAFTLMLKNTGKYMDGLFRGFDTTLTKFIDETKESKIMTYTHGQPAVCSKLGLEISKLRKKIVNSFRDFNDEINKLTCKFSGSVGNFTTLSIMFTKDEIKDMYSNMSKLLETDLIFTDSARQIDDYNSYIKLLQSIQLIALNIEELADNLWLRITRRELSQVSVTGEIGSSVMAHKINPFRLEQARGWSNLIFDHCNGLIKTLGCSHDSRDMSDSVALRFFGEIFGDLAVMITNVQIDIKRLRYNEEVCCEILERNLVSLSEQIQTFLRWYYTETIDDPYGLLEELTKGKTITYDKLYSFIDGLPITSDHKEYLKSLKADTFFGFDSFIHEDSFTRLDDIV